MGLRSWSVLGGARRLFELLAEHEELHLIVDGEHTGTSDTTEDVGTSTLEERLDTFSLDDLRCGIEGGLVLDGLKGKFISARAGNIYDVASLTSPEVIIMRRRMVSRG